MKRKLTAGALLSASAMLVVGIQAGTGTANAAPGTLSGPAAAGQRAQLVDLARGQAPALARSLALGSQEKLVVKDVVVDANGTRHLRYDRTLGGLRVIGGDLVVHQAAGGAVKSVDRATGKKLSLKSLTPSLSAAKAATKAAATVKALVGDASDKDASPLKTAGTAGTPELVVWAASGTPRLAYETVVTGVRADGTPSKLHIVTDAASGAVLSQHDAVQTASAGTGKGIFVGSVGLTTNLSGSTYQLKDTTRGSMYTTNLSHKTGGKGTLYTDSDNVWGTGTTSSTQSAAVDAQYGAAVTWDFYKNTFGRNGIKNDGVGAYSRVHYGNNYVNAFWDDTCFCMTYGDGANNTAPLTELDVSGHEMSHGVTSNSANLNYSGESGGLNEATSDIFGSMVEFYANLPADNPDYLIGELIDINGDGTPLRYMDKPSKDGGSADYWSSGVGNLDVHYSSGVANHFFYLLAEGSGAKTINGVSYNSPTYSGSTVTGIGRAKASAIWYRALTVYMTSTTNYKAARTATLSAATDLYGSGSAEYNAVAAAWTGVNVS